MLRNTRTLSLFVTDGLAGLSSSLLLQGFVQRCQHIAIIMSDSEQNNVDSYCYDKQCYESKTLRLTTVGKMYDKNDVMENLSKSLSISMRL